MGHCVDIPKTRGIIIKELWNTVSVDEEMKSYFPDFSQSDTIPRGYFFNVFLKGMASNAIN